MATMEVQPNTFGNITKPGRSGILGLPAGVSLAGVPFILVLIAMLANQWFIPALITAVLGITAAVLMVVNTKEGRSIYGRLALKAAQRRKEKTGNDLYLAGPTGRVPDGTCRLPGLAAASELFEHVDTYGSRFGILHVPATRHYTVVLEAYPDGDELVDQRHVDSMVAHWGGWLAQRGIDEGIDGASVTVESSPDTGLRLSRMMEQNHDPDKASEFASAVARDIPREYHGGSPMITTRITITFNGKRHDGSGKDRGPAEMAAEIANRLPAIIAGLYDTGAGTGVRPCTAQDIIDFTRAAYDPLIASEIELARAEGGTGLVWADAGPVFARDGYERYYHDRAVSTSWQMFEGPRGLFRSNALRRILEPTEGVLRKRVTLLYRPVPAAKATQIVERDINDATFAGSQKQRMSARDRQRLAFATKAAEEESAGAGLVRFGVTITATAAEESAFERLDQTIPSLTNQARLRLRKALANQAVAFQVGMPLGLVLPEHMLLPDEIRDVL